MQIAPVTNKTYRYPFDIGNGKNGLPWILFQVVKSRHVGRNQILGGENNKPEDVIQSCVLYLPPEALKSSMDIGWDREEYGTVLGKALETGIESSDFSKNISAVTSGMQSGNYGQGLRQLLDLGLGIGQGYGAAATGALTSGLAELGVKAIAGATPGMTEENVYAAASGTAGQRLNTRVDLLYQSIDFREHEMSFKLIPRSKPEAEAIDQILNLFHYYSLPSFGDPASLTSMLIGYPYEFKITMFSQQSLNGSGHHLNTIERSVLTHIDVNHAAANRTSFINDGTNDYYPTATILNLTFKEVRLPGRDPRRGDGGGNVVLRGTLNTLGYPNVYMDDPRSPSEWNIGSSGEISSAVLSSVPISSSDIAMAAGSEQPSDLNTPGRDNPKIEVLVRILTDPTGNPFGEWLPSFKKQLDYQLKKNQGSLYGNPNPKQVDSTAEPSAFSKVKVGDWRYVRQPFAGSLANTGPVR